MNIDLKITQVIYNLVNGNKFLKQLPYYLGLLPYELYVLPGMYIALIQVIIMSAFNPLQFHLLPHFFAFSLFQLIKGTVGRERPGCKHETLSHYIDESHCSGKQKYLSFPSGHTGIAFALATALFLEMNASDDPRFFDIPIKNKRTRNIISFIGYFVACAICIHRISKGYHYFGDTVIGAILGTTIGYISWMVMNKCKKSFKDYCEDKKSCKENSGLKSKFNLLSTSKHMQILELIGKIMLLIPITYLLLKFIIFDFKDLASIKH